MHGSTGSPTEDPCSSSRLPPFGHCICICICICIKKDVSYVSVEMASSIERPRDDPRVGVVEKLKKSQKRKEKNRELAGERGGQTNRRQYALLYMLSRSRSSPSFTSPPARSRPPATTQRDRIARAPSRVTSCLFLNVPRGSRAKGQGPRVQANSIDLSGPSRAP